MRSYARQALRQKYTTIRLQWDLSQDFAIECTVVMHETSFYRARASSRFRRLSGSIARRSTASPRRPSKKRREKELALANTQGILDNAWLETKRAGSATETYQKAKYVTQEYLLPASAQKPISSLTTEDDEFANHSVRSTNVAVLRQQNVLAMVDQYVWSNVEACSGRLQRRNLRFATRSLCMRAVTSRFSQLTDLHRNFVGELRVPIRFDPTQCLLIQRNVFSNQWCA
jgi:hypothetical protein